MLGRVRAERRAGHVQEHILERRLLHVDPKDPAALAQALISLCCDAALREAMGRRSRELALKLDWSQIAREYIDAYRAVMATSQAEGLRAKPQSALEPIRK